jgi:hypothetical protein
VQVNGRVRPLIVGVLAAPVAIAYVLSHHDRVGGMLVVGSFLTPMAVNSVLTRRRLRRLPPLPDQPWLSTGR